MNKDNIIDEMISTLNDVQKEFDYLSNNYDCDENAHRYKSRCRTCSAEEYAKQLKVFLAKINLQLKKDSDND